VSEHYRREWWDRATDVDPEEVREPYYRVVENRSRQPRVVQQFDAGHRLISTAVIRRRLGRVVRVTLYDGRSRRRAYATCRYNWRGMVQQVETFDAAGRPQVMRLFRRDWLGRLHTVERVTLAGP